MYESICDRLLNKWCGDPESRKQAKAQINRKGCGPVNKNSCKKYNYKNSAENKRRKEIVEKRAKLIARREELRARNRAMRNKRTPK
jgi:hypothetical protein